ncbi:MAG: glycoside hydrolase family 104 protein [Rhizobiales bacterium]|nr:glycoside hydrolase family 104 protein [Hyphomicrobiales bacterium]
MIRYTEGAGYSTLFGGEHFTEFEDHPRRLITRTLGGKPITSTAAGAYQFLSRTWDECKKALGLPDFSPPSQDRAALYLIERRRALPAVLEGDWPTALERCNREWASLPGSPYGQPTKSMAGCLAFLDRLTKEGGQSAAPFQENPGPTQTQPGATNMAPFVLAAIPSLIQAAPALIRLFGHGEQAEKNAKAAEIAVEIAKAVTDQPTAEGAVAAIQSDPRTGQPLRQRHRSAVVRSPASPVAAGSRARGKPMSHSRPPAPAYSSRPPSSSRPACYRWSIWSSVPSSSDRTGRWKSRRWWCRRSSAWCLARCPAITSEPASPVSAKPT